MDAGLLDETVWEGYRAYGRDPQVEAGEAGGLRWVITGAPYEGLNTIMCAPGTSAGDVALGLERFRRHEVPMLWHLLAGAPAIEDRLIAGGFAFYEEEPGMVARLSADVDYASAPAGLRIEPVRDMHQLRRFVEIWTGSKSDSFISFVTRLRAATGLDADAAFQHLLGSVEGRPVATAAVAHGARASEVQHVVTLPDLRRRGIGTALTAAALQLARRRGHEHAVLTSSPEGEGVYRALGFEQVCTVRRFLWRPLL